MNKIELTVSQIERLKDSYNKIERINPASAHYEALTQLINKLGDESLMQIANAKINFLSTKARFTLLQRAK